LKNASSCFSPNSDRISADIFTLLLSSLIRCEIGKPSSQFITAWRANSFVIVEPVTRSLLPAARALRVETTPRKAVTVTSDPASLRTLTC
jgi:hypothetical protein